MFVDQYCLQCITALYNLRGRPASSRRSPLFVSLGSKGPFPVPLCLMVLSLCRVKTMMPDRPLDTLIDPNGIAEAYWNLHSQPASAWSQEIDLRPHVEKF